MRPNQSWLHIGLIAAEPETGNSYGLGTADAEAQRGNVLVGESFRRRVWTMWDRLRSLATQPVTPEQEEAGTSFQKRTGPENASAPLDTTHRTTPVELRPAFREQGQQPLQREMYSAQKVTDSKFSAPKARPAKSNTRASTAGQRQLPGTGNKASSKANIAGSDHHISGTDTPAAATSVGSAPTDSPCQPSSVHKNETGFGGEERFARDTQNEPDAVCVVCRELANDWAVGSCDHRLCLQCAHRIRTLYNIRRCVVCNQFLEEMVVFSATEIHQISGCSSLESMDVGEQEVLWDGEAGLRYTDRAAWTRMRRLQMPTCAACGFTSSGAAELRRHLRQKHPKHALCEVCAGSGRKYWAELALYPLRLRVRSSQTEDSSAERMMSAGVANKSLRDHLRSEHAECRFCKRYFYDDDALYEHLTQTHESCMLCERDGIQYVYYRDFAALEEHYRTAHYVCEASSCRGLAFATLLDLQMHHQRQCPTLHGSATETRNSTGRTFRFQELQQASTRNPGEAPPSTSSPTNMVGSDERGVHARTRALRRGFSGTSVVYADLSDANLWHAAGVSAGAAQPDQTRHSVEDSVHRAVNARQSSPQPLQNADPADESVATRNTNGNVGDNGVAIRTPIANAEGESPFHSNTQPFNEEASSRPAASAGPIGLSTATHTVPRSETEALRRGALLFEQLKKLLRAESPLGREVWATFRSYCERFLRHEVDADTCVHALGRLLIQQGATSSMVIDLLFEMSVLQPDASLRQSLLAATKKYSISVAAETSETRRVEPNHMTWTLSNVVRSSSTRSRTALAPEAFPRLRRASPIERHAPITTPSFDTSIEQATAASASRTETSPGSAPGLDESLQAMYLDHRPAATAQPLQRPRLPTSSRGSSTVRFDGGDLFEPGRGGRVLDVAQLARERQAQRLHRGVLIGQHGFAWERERNAQRRLAAKTQQRGISTESSAPPSTK